ncbi:MAG: DUF721 domain-containing protein [Planctomycetota bacterium]
MKDSESDRGRGPQPFQAIVNRLLSRRGYTDVLGAQQMLEVLQEVMGQEMMPRLAIGRLRRGVLELYCNDSVTMQEATFQKRRLVRKLQQALPDSKIDDVRLKVRVVEQ